MTSRTCATGLLFILACAVCSHAYVGPGVGVTLIGWFAGCALATGAALWAVIAWPVRRLLARRRAAREPAAVETVEEKNASDSNAEV